MVIIVALTTGGFGRTAPKGPNEKILGLYPEERRISRFFSGREHSRLIAMDW
jgi:hypothetical protein